MALGERHAITLDTLIVAGWSVVLSRLSGQKDLVIGLALPNRSRAETA
jgi:non-ribosomal peptide synthetase component F